MMNYEEMKNWYVKFERDKKRVKENKKGHKTTKKVIC